MPDKRGAIWALNLFTPSCQGAIFQALSFPIEVGPIGQ
jgi:hypothetical protein